MLTDQLQDSPRERSESAREFRRMKFSEVPEDFNNIVLQNQQLIMAEAAKSGAYTVNQLSEILKAVLPTTVPQGERADPDPTPVGRPPAPPPSTTPSQPEKQRGQMPEKLSKIMERTARIFCEQLRHMHRAKERLQTSDGNSEVLERKPFTLPVRMKTFLELHHVVRTG